jgi:hypothetical protein
MATCSWTAAIWECYSIDCYCLWETVQLVALCNTFWIKIPIWLQRSWLTHCATRWMVVGSIPNGVIRIFYWHNPSGRTMAVWLTQPLTEMSTRNISWGVKVTDAYGWQPYQLHVPIVLKSGSLILLDPSEPVQACSGIAVPLPFVWLQ